MGAWGVHSFENDDAGDLLVDFEELGVDTLHVAFEASLQTPEDGMAEAER